MMTEYFVSVRKRRKIFYALLIGIVAGAFLPGCQKEDKNNLLVAQSVKTYFQAATLSGSVTAANGAVAAGRVDATDENGNIVATGAIQSGGRYAVVVPAGTNLPIVLKAYPEKVQGVEGEALVAVVLDPSLKRYEINPLSTAIAAKAKTMGGYTAKNLMEAAMTSVAAPDANKTTGGFRGDPTKQYGGWH
ncbi:MAG: hypothetical protein ACU837_07080 [Gammaproteobacteria bacterium]